MCEHVCSIPTFWSQLSGATRELRAGYLEMALAREFDLLLSVPLMFEYEAVLTRLEHLSASRASVEDVGDVLDGLAAVGRRVRLAFRWRPALPDANDDMVLETAVNGQAYAIVTFNERDFNPVAARFGCRVMQPREFLRLLANETG
jgi:predicted nucleic acid-binding protein